MTTQAILIRPFWLISALVVLSFTSTQTYSSSADFKALVADSKILDQGKKQFLFYCASCHKKDLSGAAGVNLKDGEWIHGGQPEEILHSIKNGFSTAGMPGFERILSESDQHAVLAYVLSKREGFENLHYKIYQLDNEKDTEVAPSDVVKSGKLKRNFADFDLPEIPHYAIEFTGTFYAPRNEPSHLFTENAKGLKFEVELNGKLVESSRTGWVRKWPLKRGMQTLKLTFFSSDAKQYQRNIELYVINDDGSIKLFPVSMKAYRKSKNTHFDIKVSGNYLIQQKKIVKLPPYSIAVGSPQKINYAFNTRNCSINGLWRGDLLNVGPNIGGRGKDGSIPLGEWIFHYPQQLVSASSLTKQNESKKLIQSCDFIKYRIDDSAPEFHYSINDVTLSMTTDFSQANVASFVHKIIDNKKKIKSLNFSLPKSKQLTVKSSEAIIEENSLEVDISQHDQFSIDLIWQGK